MKKLSIGLWGLAALAVVALGAVLVSQESAKNPLSFHSRYSLAHANFLLEPVQKQPAKTLRKYSTGRKVNLKEVQNRINASLPNHLIRKSILKKAVPDSYDLRTSAKCILPVDDQGSCGDCFGVSAADGCSMALIQAGLLPFSEDGRLSSQYGLDCGKFEGGCNGGDEGQVIDEIKRNGFPLTKDYGPYRASPGQCKSTASMKFLKIQDYGFCDPSIGAGGVANAQKMMEWMYQTQCPLSVAFDAGGCDGYQWPQVMRGGGNNVDHAVLCIGWKTEGGKVIFLGMNQWGSSWGGPGGTFWIEAGAWSWGTEAMYIVGGAGPTPPPPPTPPTPGNGTPPFKLYEGTAPMFTQVGTPAGYATLATAQVDAKTIGTADKQPVLIYDSSKPPVLIDTVQPGFATVIITLTDSQVAAVLAQAKQSEPPMLKLKAGLNYWAVIMDLQKLAADITAAAPVIMEDVRQLLIDLGMSPVQAKKLQLAK